jgi:hypothetical protein
MSDRNRILVIVLVVVAVVGGIAGIGIYTDRVAPFRTVVLRVDDSEVRMRYFLKRVSASGSQALPLLSALTREEILLKVLPEPPYRIDPSNEDVEAFGRRAAQGAGAAITDAEYGEWLRQQLNTSGFSEAEFLDIMRRNLMTVLLDDYLGARVETVAAQVLLQLIAVADAQVALTRLEAGESFADVARELNTDPQLQRSGGEWGWFPRDGLPRGLATLAFDQLAIGEAGGPLALPPSERGQVFALIRVVDRVAAREITGAMLEVVKGQALENWYVSETQLHTVSFHGFSNGYDSATDAWVNWQVQRNRQEGRGRQ